MWRSKFKVAWRELKYGKEDMESNSNIAPMLTTSDVARILNIHINTVRRWSNQGRLKAYRIGSRGDRRFQQEDIASFLSQKSKTVKGRRATSFNRSISKTGDNLLVDSKI
jgi:excisionase family DNA binding protein